MQNSDLSLKQQQFNSSMELYDTKSIYKIFSKMVSITNVSLQALLLFLVLPFSIGPLWQIFSFITAFILADFINGFVHMYMDNNDNYKSFAGPFVAAFHLHHRTPLYKNNILPIVYYNETGSKIWLAAYLGAAAILIGSSDINPVVSYILMYTGILSSIAEVSHYCCHIPDPGLAGYLSKAGLFLSKKHHARHHIEDNVRYAFLNGMSDPVLDIIAKKFYAGYKNTTDRHYERYTGVGTDNRG